MTFLSGNKRLRLEGHGTDLSEAGIGILVAAELNVGEVVGLGFTVGGTFPRDLRAVLRYRRGYHYGFEFLSLSTEQQESLREHVKSLKPID
jgi:PilZ domain